MVPLFGDVVIGPFIYIHQTANFDPQHWPRCCSTGVSQQSTVLTRMSEYRQQHVELMCELMLLSDQRHKLIQVNASTAVSVCYCTSGLLSHWLSLNAHAIPTTDKLLLNTGLRLNPQGKPLVNLETTPWC